MACSVESIKCIFNSIKRCFSLTLIVKVNYPFFCTCSGTIIRPAYYMKSLNYAVFWLTWYLYLVVEYKVRSTKYRFEVVFPYGSCVPATGKRFTNSPKRTSTVQYLEREAIYIPGETYSTSLVLRRL
jgi:hypothetical protein